MIEDKSAWEDATGACFLWFMSFLGATCKEDRMVQIAAGNIAKWKNMKKTFR